MPLQAHDFITCPNCKNKLIANAVKCNFCGADVSKVARVAAPTKQKIAAFETPKWIVGLYYAVAAFWILSGLAGLVLSAIEEGGADIVGVVFGAANVILGIGLAFKIKLLRKIVNILSFISILRGVYMLFISFVATAFSSGLGVLIMVMAFFNIVSGGLTIWLLAETAEWDEY